MDKFEAGRSYDWAERGFDPFTVLARTEKTITVCNGTNVWKMLVRTDDDGNEWVRDSSEPRYAQEMFISRAMWIIPNREYGYRITIENDSGKELVFSEYCSSTHEWAKKHMDFIANCLERFYKGYSIASKELLCKGETIETV